MKALEVLSYLLVNGSETVVEWAKENFYLIKTLYGFEYFDGFGRNLRAFVRDRATTVTKMLEGG